MKIRKNIMAARYSAQSGTSFYEISLDDAISVFRSNNNNAWIYKSLLEYGWDCIDFQHNLFGSKVIDNTLYLCVTDGQEILVQDDFVDPETALNLYDLSELEDYIESADSDIITYYITEYEIDEPQFDKWAESLLKSGYTFTKLVSDYDSFDV